MKNNVFLHCISSFKSNSWKDTATRSFTLADRPIIFQKSLERHSSQHCLKKNFRNEFSIFKIDSTTSSHVTSPNSQNLLSVTSFLLMLPPLPSSLIIAS